MNWLPQSWRIDTFLIWIAGGFCLPCYPRMSVNSPGVAVTSIKGVILITEVSPMDAVLNIYTYIYKYIYIYQVMEKQII